MQPGFMEAAQASPLNRGKVRALAVSLALHATSFFLLMQAPPLSVPTLPPPSPSEFEQAFKGKEDKIVWYKFRELPRITPQKPLQPRPPRSAEKALQAIVSSPKNAPQRRQMVWTPEPLPAETPPPDLPNLLAVKLPPKQFVAPPDIVKADVKIEMPETPETLPSQLQAAALPAERLPARPFSPPQAAAKRETAKIETPSESPIYQGQPSPSAKLPAVRLPARPFTPPAQQPATPGPTIGAAVETAAITANAPASASIPDSRLPARAYAPPQPAAGTRPTKDLAPMPPMDGNPGEITMAIAGLNPVATPITLPPAPSPAQFSAGPQVRKEGADADGESKGITAPDLYADGQHPPPEKNGAKPNLLARSTPTSRDMLTEALRYGQPVISTDAAVPAAASATRPTATRVSNAPDPRFNGRDIYMMAIQMPNLTSYSGSWLMWYADRTARRAGLDPISAPVAHRKVDPKYFAAVVEEHVEGRVQLSCIIGREGTVTSVEILHGADERLNRAAEEALSKWEFYPATRNGQPVEVDVVVEIPFVLAPRDGSRR
jgi:TonB family protein